MSNDIPHKEVMSPTELAAYLGLSIPTLDRMRSRGEGPPFIKMGKRRILYMWSSVQAWIESRERVSTKDTVDDH